MADEPHIPYITADDVNAAGYPVDDSNRSQVEASIIAWAQVIDMLTGQFFESRSATLLMDGNDSDTLFLPVPIISCSSLCVNGDMANVLNPSCYSVYNKRGPVGDDRRNPKIVWVSRFTGGFMPHASARGQGPIFSKGSQNQKIVGNFGFTESDGSTPFLIKRVLTKLVIRELNNPDMSDSSSPLAAGNLVMEVTDGHTQQFSGAVVKPSLAYDIVKDQESAKIISMYRKPIAMAVPGSLSWVLG